MPFDDHIDLKLTDSTVHVHIAGSGKPILFLHGYPLDSRMWDRCISLLSQHFLCIAPDFRGFGRNREERFGFSLIDLAADCDKLLQVMQVREPVTVCGLSMGGYVAMEFVERYRDRVARAILTNTRCSPDDAKAAATRLETATKAIQLGTAPVVTPMLEKLLSSNSLNDQSGSKDTVLEMMLSTRPSTIAWSQMAMASRRDFCERMQDWNLPVVCVGGEHDTICPPSAIEQMHRSIPNSWIHILSNTAHLTPLECPDEFASIVIRD